MAGARCWWGASGSQTSGLDTWTSGGHVICLFIVYLINLFYLGPGHAPENSHRDTDHSRTQNIIRNSRFLLFILDISKMNNELD